jgi:hypothetical protein
MVKTTGVGVFIKVPLSSYTSALIKVDSSPPPSLTTILPGIDEGISINAQDWKEGSSM